MAHTDIPSIGQEAGVACIANNVGVDLLLTGKHSEALFHFAVASEKLLKLVVANGIHGLSILEEETTTQQERHTCIFSLSMSQHRGEVILVLSQVPSKSFEDELDRGFLSSGMSREWLLSSTLIAIHNAVAACKMLKELEQAMALIETAWELINAQVWSWEDAVLGNALRGGQSQTIKCLLVSITYNRGRLFLEMFNKRLLQEQDTQDSYLLAEELHNLLKEAVDSFSLVAASDQEEKGLLILQEQPEGCRRFQEINLFFVAKAWSWLGYALILRDATSSLVDVVYGIARNNYNSLCCIAGSDRWTSSYCYAPMTVPKNVTGVDAAPSA
jgi:hypothetical protein